MTGTWQRRLFELQYFHCYKSVRRRILNEDNVFCVPNRGTKVKWLTCHDWCTPAAGERGQLERQRITLRLRLLYYPGSEAECLIRDEAPTAGDGMGLIEAVRLLGWLSYVAA